MPRAIPLPPILSESSLGRRMAIGALLLLGVWLRVSHADEHGSDVLSVTHAALSWVGMGENPYGHGYAVSQPPGAPFAYGPLALLWYAVTPGNIELIVSVLLLFIMALANRLLGLAGLALWIPLGILANDGSNDTSAGLFLLGAMLLAERRPGWGAAALAGVVAFKPYALAFLPPLVAFAGPGVLIPFALASTIAWGPAVLLWGAGNIVTSLRMATDVHAAAWYSLGELLKVAHSRRGALLVVQLASGAAASIVSLLLVRSARRMAVWGTVIFAATLFTGWWATVAYWAAVVPLLAWHVDAWFADAAGWAARVGSGRRGEPVADLAPAPAPSAPATTQGRGAQVGAE